MKSDEAPSRRIAHPYGLVVGALGLGFVLGGGLSLRLAVRLAGIGLRLG